MFHPKKERDRWTDRERPVQRIAPDGFVVDGLARLRAAVEAEVRAEIEEKYSQQWNASGVLKRWRIKWRLEQEIAQSVRERWSRVSDCSMF